MADGKRGRPSKLTDECRDRVIEALQAGNYLDTAARLAGIDPATLHRWLARSEPEFCEFREAVEKARATAEARNVAIIQRAATRTWQAAGWWLERSYPDRWARKDRLDARVSGSLGLTLAELVQAADGEASDAGAA